VLIAGIRQSGRLHLSILAFLSARFEGLALVLSPRSAPAAVVICLALLLTLGAEPAGAKDRHPDRFHSGEVYRGSFPDPDVFRLGRLWVALSTTVARRSVPMMTSHNGRTWRARVAHGHGARRTNGALVDVPRWAVRHRTGRHRAFVPSWAPSIGRATNGRWLIAYAAPLRRHPAKRCIAIASSRHPLGPFRDHRRRPIVCPRRQGAIDPDLFRSRGRTYLLWKTEGRGRARTTIYVRALRADGRGFRPGSRAHALLRPAYRWEHPLVENPSMIRYHGRLYLFYSANRWYTRRYAIGYAVCRSVLGPCHRRQRRPLLSSGRGIAGPGGQSAFHGPRGRLLLAYAAWPAGRVGSERRLHIATLQVRKHGRLVVTRRRR
jgi:beta-xylosidase